MVVRDLSCKKDKICSRRRHTELAYQLDDLPAVVGGVIDDMREYVREIIEIRVAGHVL